jgi:hypothetical protein
MKGATSKKTAPPKRATSKKRSDSNAKALERYQFHRSKAQFHNAQADLVEAKLKTQGKRIDEWGDAAPSQARSKPKIVPVK